MGCADVSPVGPGSAACTKVTSSPARASRTWAPAPRARNGAARTPPFGSARRISCSVSTAVARSASAPLPDSGRESMPVSLPVTRRNFASQLGQVTRWTPPSWRRRTGAWHRGHWIISEFYRRVRRVTVAAIWFISHSFDGGPRAPRLYRARVLRLRSAAALLQAAATADALAPLLAEVGFPAPPLP